MSGSQQKGIRAVLVGIGINACLAAVKGTAGVLGNTYALIADAIESTSDIVVSMIVYGGLKISVQPPDEDHPYGHGKAEPLAAFIVAGALGVAALLIAFQSIEEILSPHYSPAPWTLLVLVAVIVTKEGLFRFVFKIGDEGDSTAVKADAWHHRSDAITSAAAFIGIAIALYGGPSFASADDWAALLASRKIAFKPYKIEQTAVGDIMGSAPTASSPSTPIISHGRPWPRSWMRRLRRRSRSGS